MQYATFINFTDKEFTGYWNGKPYTFQPGQKKEHLNSMIAQHFAKHLTNQVLTEAGKERSTSPKKPEDVPEFMNVFNKAFKLEGEGREVDPETGLAVDGTGDRAEAGLPDEPGMNIKTVPRQPAGQIDPYDANAQPQTGPGSKPQVIGTAVEGADEETFEGKEESETDGEA